MESEAVGLLNRLPHLQGGVVKCNRKSGGQFVVVTQNRHDTFAVATCKGTTVVGYVRV